jgi:DNA-binding NtrC family response regulator
MRNSQSALRQTEWIHPPTAWTCPASATISEPTKTLLVVDDEPMVRELETHILRQQGYTVLAAESAAEALRLAGETAAIHLLITDLMMPEVDGLELTRRFRTVHPKTPVLMVSGSLPLLRIRNEQDLERFDFLAKPFQFDELLHKVRTLLDATVPLPIRKLWHAN